MSRPTTELYSYVHTRSLHYALPIYEVHFTIVSGIMHAPQPEVTLDRLRSDVRSHSPFILAGLSPIVSLTGSVVASLALLEGAADAETIWNEAQLDELWQFEMWGEDALAVEKFAKKRTEFDDCVSVGKIARG